MRKACLALVLLAVPALAQSNNINPSQIRPGTEGQVLATKSGKSTWDRGNCGAAGTVQLSAGTSGTAGLTCDESVSVDTTAHTVNVGTLPTNHVKIGALGTPTLWTFDTTTAATALASLGGGTVAAGTTGQVAVYPSAGSNLAGSSSIGLTSLTLAGGSALTANQGNGAKVQHSTGSTTTGNAAAFDAAGNIVDSGHSALTYFSTSTDVTGSRSLTTPYQNTGTTPMYVSGYATIHSGSGDSRITFLVGPSSPSINCDSLDFTGTISGERVPFKCMVPPGSFYEVTGTNLISAIGSWLETQ